MYPILSVIQRLTDDLRRSIDAKNEELKIVGSNTIQLSIPASSAKSNNNAKPLHYIFQMESAETKEVRRASCLLFLLICSVLFYAATKWKANRTNVPKNSFSVRTAVCTFFLRFNQYTTAQNTDFISTTLSQDIPITLSEDSNDRVKQG